LESASTACLLLLYAAEHQDAAGFAPAHVRQHGLRDTQQTENIRFV
jgi:hypothetical protein